MLISSHELSILVADSVYVNMYLKNSFAYPENDETSWIRYLTEVKSAGLWSYLEVSRISSHTKASQISRHTKELWCIAVCLWMTINVVPSISFQTFCTGFKIVVDSWEFSMLLLYILWDDWPIFMISASKEQLQQQLEYTLQKPDYHSWWFSKMQSGREDTLEEGYAIRFCFKLGKKATETYAMLQTAFRLSCMNWAWVFEWHKRFKEGRESVREDERCGRSKEVNTPELIGQRVRVRVWVTMLRF